MIGKLIGCFLTSFLCDRSDEAAAVLKKVASANGVNIQHVSHSQATVHEDEEKIPEEKGFLHAYTLLKKYPRLVVRMLIIFFNWIVVNMTYYGLSLNVANLSGSIRVNFLLSSLVELTGYCGAWVLLDRLGRKRLHCACMTLAGVALLATILTVTLGGADLQWATTALAMIGKMGVSASFSIIFLLTSELYPTVIRNFGLGGSATVGRFGSIVSPYIADLALFVEGRIGPALPLIVFGGLTMAAGGLSLMLPETLHRKLPETLEDAVNFGK
nr:hypothetical protein BaRGS_004839 [Batillaria attramentaria]